MPIDENGFQSLIKEKCLHCFRKDSTQDRCMLFAEKHAGIELCLGPFKDQEDRMRKIREDFSREDRAFDLRKFISQSQMDIYEYRRLRFKVLSGNKKDNDEQK